MEDEYDEYEYDENAKAAIEHLKNMNADSHSDIKKHRKRMRHRKVFKEMNLSETKLIRFIYLLYHAIDDLTKIPYYLKYAIKYIFESYGNILKFKNLIQFHHHFNITQYVKIMMEFSVVLGFHFMPKRPLLIICSYARGYKYIDISLVIYNNIDISLVIYILENKIDIITDQVFYEITRQLRSPEYIKGITHIINHYYPIERFLKFVETWKTKNLTTWWVKPRNHVVGVRLNRIEHVETLIMSRVIMSRVIKLIKCTTQLEYVERAFQIFIGFTGNSETFRKSKHAKICLANLITNIMKFRNYMDRMKYTIIIETAMTYINCNINELITISFIQCVKRDLLEFKKINEQCHDIRMLLIMCSKRHVMYDIKRYITSYLI